MKKKDRRLIIAILVASCIFPSGVFVGYLIGKNSRPDIVYECEYDPSGTITMTCLRPSIFK